MDLNELRASYQKKVLNQELSLRELAARKTILDSYPSKVQLRIGGEGCRTIDPALYQKVARTLFDYAYFVDFMGVDDAFAEGLGPVVFAEMQKHPAINWHTATFLWMGDPGVWYALASLGTLFGIVIQGATEKAWNAVCDWPMGFGGFLSNVELVARAHADSGRGSVYFIAPIKRPSLSDFREYVRIALDHNIDQIQFSLDPSIRAEEIDRSELEKAVELGLENDVSIQLMDQTLSQAIDPKLVIQAAKAPDRNVNFPPEGVYDPEFERLHSWRPLDAKVLDRSRVSVFQKCFKPFHYVSVDLDGKLGPCNHLTEPFLPLGDLNLESFEEIWNGEAMQNFRKSLLSRQPQDSRCKWCFQYRLTD